MAHQQITRQWWEGRDRFDLYVSRAVVAEARRGNCTPEELMEPNP